MSNLTPRGLEYKALSLRTPIYCPECHERYALLNMKDGKVRLEHQRNECNRRVSANPYSGASFTFKETDYIQLKPMGEGIALIQLPEHITCPECGFYFGGKEIEDITVQWYHLRFPFREIYSGSNCKAFVRYPLASFTVFV